MTQGSYGKKIYCDVDRGARGKGFMVKLDKQELMGFDIEN